MAFKLSMQEKMDLTKFFKFFALKFTQIIVQSRLGQKVHTKCKSYITTGSDWFNLAIIDIPEVTAETRRALCGDILSSRYPLCVEISLKTVDGDSMLLETWCLNVDPEQYDHHKQIVYNCMGTLLKSLISVTRTTPAYKLSRRQGSDSYVICYRIYMGEPLLHNLGEEFEKVSIGHANSPLGTIKISVYHRTKLTISPQQGRQISIMLKSDHFKKDLSPKHKKSEEKEKEIMDLSKPFNYPFSDENRVKRKQSFELISDAPAEGLEGLYELVERAQKMEDEREKRDQEEPAKPDHGTVTPPPPEVKVERRKTLASLIPSLPDDLFRVNLNVPFANTEINKEVSSLLRDCLNAPPLETYSEQSTFGDLAPVIAQTIRDLETVHIPSYNTMINSFATENDNDNNEDSS